MNEPAFEPARLAKLVRNARLKIGLSKSEVAKIAGMSDAWLGQLERGGQPGRRPKRPRPENIRALAMVLRLNEATALKFAGYSNDVPIELTGGRPSCSEFMFTANMNRLPATVRALFMQLVEAVAVAEESRGDQPKGGAAA